MAVERLSGIRLSTRWYFAIALDFSPALRLSRPLQQQSAESRSACDHRALTCANDYRPLLVVELDDSSHDRPAQRARDAKKDAVLAAAGVSVVRFRGMVSAEQIRQAILKALRGLDHGTGGTEDVASPGRKVPYIGRL